MPNQSAQAFEFTASAVRHALVVEDELPLGALFQGILHSRLGCHTTLTGSVAAAIGHLEQEQVDFVVCDLAMKGSSGLDLAAWLQTHQPKLASRLLIVTANVGRTDLVQAIRRGEVRALYKPFDAMALIQAVTQACGTNA